MSGLRSWLGSILTVILYFVVRRFSAGIAAPTFVTVFFAFTFIWTLVLRVPELKHIEPAEPEPPRPPIPAAAPLPTKSAEADENTSSGKGGSDPEETMQKDAAGGNDSVADACTDPSPVSEAQVPSQAADVRDELTVSEDAGAVSEDLRATAPSNQDTSANDTNCAAEGGSAPSDAVPAQARAGVQDDDSDESEDEETRKRRELELEDEHCDPDTARELKAEGNEFFKAGKLYDAIESYSEALYMMPSTEAKDRAVLFCNRAACRQKLSLWEDVIADCRKAIELDPEYAKAYHRRSAANEALNKWHDANEDLKKVIELDPSMKAKEYKHQAVLEARAQEQFEKDKDEMMGKLKDLGNMVLGKFGMSTDNFKCEKDPSTGSYSLKFQQ